MIVICYFVFKSFQIMFLQEKTNLCYSNEITRLYLCFSFFNFTHFVLDCTFMEFINQILCYFFQDAYNCVPQIDNDTGFFAVYDGHGGMYFIILLMCWLFFWKKFKVITCLSFV